MKLNIFLNFQNGLVHGMLLGIDNYLRNFRSTDEALIVNNISISGVEGFSSSPVYTLTKFAGVGAVKSWGNKDHFDRTGVRVIGILPGVTETIMIHDEIDNMVLGPEYKNFLYIPGVVQR